MITDMIVKLEKQAGADATEEAYCDKELRESNEKKAGRTAEIEQMTTRVDQAAAKSAKLKEEAATLGSELSEYSKSWAEMDKLRGEMKAAYEESKAESEISKLSKSQAETDKCLWCAAKLPKGGDDLCKDCLDEEFDDD